MPKSLQHVIEEAYNDTTFPAECLFDPRELQGDGLIEFLLSELLDLGRWEGDNPTPAEAHAEARSRMQTILEEVTRVAAAVEAFNPEAI